MNARNTQHELRASVRLAGPFALCAPDGADVTPRGRRAKALLAMLAVAPDGRRSRKWLQDKLWSDRDEAHGAGSLRQELAAIRRAVNGACPGLVEADHQSVWLDLAKLDVLAGGGPSDEFLEGIDVRDPEFEEWLRTERQHRPRNPDEMPPPVAPVAEPPRSAATIKLLAIRPDREEAQAQAFATGVSDELRLTLDALAGALTVVVGDEDEAAYELSGTLRTGTRGRLGIHLVERSNGELVWSGRIDCDVGGGFEEQERLAREIAEGLQRTLTDGEWTRHWADRTSSIAAWEEFQKGRMKEARIGRAAHRAARMHMRKAIDHDPMFISPKITLGFLLLDEIRLEWAEDFEASLAEAQRLADDIDRLETGNAQARSLRAFISVLEFDMEGALAIMESVVLDFPESPEMRAYQALVVAMSGHFDRAITIYRHALGLVRHPASWIWSNLGLDLLAVDDQPRAEEALRAALATNRRNVRAHLGMVVLSVRRGDMETARAWAARTLELEPELVASRWRAMRYYRDRTPIERMAQELAAAGL